MEKNLNAFIRKNNKFINNLKILKYIKYQYKKIT